MSPVGRSIFLASHCCSASPSATIPQGKALTVVQRTPAAPEARKRDHTCCEQDKTGGLRYGGQVGRCKRLAQVNLSRLIEVYKIVKKFKITCLSQIRKRVRIGDGRLGRLNRRYVVPFTKPIVKIALWKRKCRVITLIELPHKKGHFRYAQVGANAGDEVRKICFIRICRGRLGRRCREAWSGSTFSIRLALHPKQTGDVRSFQRHSG